MATNPMQQPRTQPLSQIPSGRTPEERQKARLDYSRKWLEKQPLKPGQITKQGIDFTKLRKSKNGWIVDHYFKGKHVGARKAQPFEVSAYKKYGKGAAASPNPPASTGSSTTTTTSSNSGVKTDVDKPLTTPTFGLPTNQSRFDPGVDKFFNRLYDPARRQIKREQDRLAQQKTASEGAWNAFNAWNEERRAEAAGVVGAQAAANTAQQAEINAQADARIASMVDQARGSLGGSDFAQATGSGVAASNAADMAASGAANVATQGAMDKILAQRAADEQRANTAMSAEGFDSINSNYAKASDALAQRNTELENSINAAKLDRFYKDRAYDLEKATAAWAMDAQNYQLGQTDTANENTAQAARDANTVAALKQAGEDEKAVQKAYGESSKELDKIMKENNFAGKAFTAVPAHEQGQIMQRMAEILKQQYGRTLSQAEAQGVMTALFGSRFSEVPSAKSDFYARYPG